MAKLKITIEIDATDADPSNVLDLAQDFVNDFVAEHGGEVDEGTGVSVEEMPNGKPAMVQCCECSEWKHDGKLDEDERCEDCMDPEK